MLWKLYDSSSISMKSLNKGGNIQFLIMVGMVVACDIVLIVLIIETVCYSYMP